MRGVHFQKIQKKRCRRVKNGAGRPYMASVMGICGGLVGPKSGNVGFSLGFNGVLWRVKIVTVRFRNVLTERAGLDLGRFEVQKVRFSIKNVLCLYLKICFPQQREAYFQKNHEKSGRKVKNGARIKSDTSKYHQHGVGYMKMAWKLCRIYH